MLIELVAVGEGYTVVVTAAGSGNRLRFRNTSQALARSLFKSDLRPAPARSAEEQRRNRENS